MGQQSGAKIDHRLDRLTTARGLAERVTNALQRDLLVEACDVAIAAHRVVDLREELDALLAYWRSMPEHITSSLAIQQLDAVANGGKAPRNAMTAAKK